MIGSTDVIDGNISSAEVLLIEGKISGTITALVQETLVGQLGTHNSITIVKPIPLQPSV